MRHVLTFAIVLLAGVASASAQVSERLDVSAIARTDRVSFEVTRRRACLWQEWVCRIAYGVTCGSKGK